MIRPVVFVLLFALPVAAQDLPDLQRGDVIFQNSRSEQSLAISLATGSDFTHVGIIDFDGSGQPVVLEAVRTTRETPLRDWLTHGVDADVAIYRLNGLTADQAKAVT
ncbi:MAG: YiiX/YebB-like N1pC/P60 family cysteine hydrolase, partial [Tabrizicola sp.]